MRRTPFHEWLEDRVQEVPDATTLAILIARSGATGVSRDALRRLAHISTDALEDLLAALVASGQVVVLKMNGELVYRATS